MQTPDKDQLLERAQKRASSLLSRLSLKTPKGLEENTRMKHVMKFNEALVAAKNAAPEIAADEWPEPFVADIDIGAGVPYIVGTIDEIDERARKILALLTALHSAAPVVASETDPAASGDDT